jgi:hypothetical protein
MNVDKLCFEIHGLEGRVWVRPYAGNVEFNGETYDTLAEAIDALPMFARELGWTDYYTTLADFSIEECIAHADKFCAELSDLQSGDYPTPDYDPYEAAGESHFGLPGGARSL